MSENEYIKKVKSIINEDKEHFFFLCNDIIHAIGVLGLFERFNIISYDKSQMVNLLRNDGVNVSLLEEEYPDFDDLYTTNNLIKHEYAKKIISSVEAKGSGKKNLLVFKNSAIVEENAKKLGVRLLAASANVSRGIENKVNFYRLLQDEDLSVIPGEVINMTDEIMYDEFANKYGDTYVLQASKGFAGNKTFLINGADDFNNVKKDYKKREMRLTRFIQGITITINACATEIGTMVKQPFYQLTGFDALTRNKMGTCGNDYSVNDMDGSIIDGIIEFTEKIGEIIYRKGFKGVFGVDYLISDGKCYFIECNPRFVTSLPVFTRLEMINGEPPLVAFHILENMGKIEKAKDVFYEFKKPLRCFYSGSQVIMHNLKSEAGKINSDMRCGIYGFNNGNPVFIREGYKIDDILSDDEFLFIPKAQGRIINSGMECARIITKNKALNGNRLSGKIEKAVNVLYAGLMG